MATHVTALASRLVPQMEEKSALRTAEEHKMRADQQHASEITALSSNLASLRQQNEGSRRKAQEVEGRLTAQSHELLGQ